MFSLISIYHKLSVGNDELSNLKYSVLANLKYSVLYASVTRRL